MSYLKCPICGAPFQTCGPDHMTLPPIDIEGARMAPKPGKTREYTYLVGRVPITAMLTEEQATRYGATPVEAEEEPAQEEVGPAQEEVGPDVPDKARRPRKRA